MRALANAALQAVTSDTVVQGGCEMAAESYSGTGEKSARSGCRNLPPWKRDGSIESGARRLRALALLSALLLSGALLPALAQDQELDIPNRRGWFTPGELSLLPPYCNAMQGRPDHTGPGGARWRAWLGEDLQHVHHYCRGLRDARFATLMARITPQQRTFLWERAVNEYDYMIRTSKATMPIMPEILLRRGEALLRLNKVMSAEESFQRAIKLKADYWEAYAAWADNLMSMKQFDRAREVLENGLTNAPQATPLQERLQRLSATPDKPTPAKLSPSRAAPKSGG